MRFLINCIFFLSFYSIFSQSSLDFEAVDSLYREDQFYFGITYTTLQKRPAGVTQNKFTPSFSIGFLRDMPFNKARNKAFAAGLGYSWNNYNQNILIYEANGIPEYSTIISATNFDKNKLMLHSIDIPLEFRWRTSTAESHKFWRIYSGLKFSYLFYTQSNYKDHQTSIKVIGNPDINKFQFGTYLSIGYNTVNFNVYYGLKPIFKSGVLNGSSLDMNTLNFGFMFYIL
ncbi:MAG: PorT family protein [Flavobacteriaceae bacterium]|nr:PorT family protein [Flavobacteriaceae bacterium]